MEELIKIRSANFRVDRNIILDNISFEIHKNKHVAIIGTSGSGKTMLLKGLSNRIDLSNLKINGKDRDLDKDNFFKQIQEVFLDTCFLTKSIVDEIGYGLSLRNISKKDYQKEMVEIFDFFRIVDDTLENLSRNMIVFIKIISSLILKPELIIIDDLFIYLNTKEIDLIMSYMRKNNITMLLATSNIEDTLYVDYIYVMNNRKIIANGDLDSIYQQEKLLNKIGIGLPFIVDLSKKLKLYGIIDKIYYKKEKLVGDLWK